MVENSLIINTSSYYKLDTWQTLLKTGIRNVKFLNVVVIKAVLHYCSAVSYNALLGAWNEFEEPNTKSSEYQTHNEERHMKFINSLSYL